MGYIHLHCHSAYSLLEGTIKPQALVTMAKRFKMPAIALTDRGNMYGTVDFYTHTMKAGLKPVIGMEVDLDDGSQLVLLARNNDGYRNLSHLATYLGLHADPASFHLRPAGFDDEEEIAPWDPGTWGVPVFGSEGQGSVKPASIQRPYKPPTLPRELLLSGRYARGLIALSGGRRGLVNRLVAEGKRERAARAAGILLSAFGEGNFFIEIQSWHDGDSELVAQLYDLSARLNIPIVATNDVLYAVPGDAPIALALAAARKGLRQTTSGSTSDDLVMNSADELRVEIGTERYFKSLEAMAELFKDYPQALANAGFIADQCNVDLPTGKTLFPKVEIPRNDTPYSRLWKLCFAGAIRRYRPLTAPVLTRLKHELEVIDGLGFSPYFLVVRDIVRFAQSRDIPILARGSVANSLVAYVLGITQVDPLAPENDLLFERFLNASRAEFELPDIDLDLCWRRRDEVLHYVYDLYGHDHVAVAGTYITFRLRSAWREMAKVSGLSAERIRRVADHLPYRLSAEDVMDDPNVEAALAEALAAEHSYKYVVQDEKDSPRFRNEREQEILTLCKAIEGLPRHIGMHCGGVVISPPHTPLANLVPLQKAARDPSMAITQYDKDGLEAMGLMKLDLLGSRALTALVDAVRTSGLAAQKGKSRALECLEAIPLDDKLTYRMLSQGETLGCFQLESPGMRALLKWLRPTSLREIAIAISLFRPGPLEGGFLETFMRRHLRQEPVTYHHPAMEPILSETNGVILYQEQFLKLAHSLAGMDLGEAEQLRKELGRSHTPEERTRMGSRFLAGAIERGIDQSQAEKVWEIIAGYTGFGFCKAHACSYALTAYRSAYMKAHHPAEFLASVVNNGGGYYGPTVYLEDARRLRVQLLLPDANRSGAWCEAGAHPRSIRLGLQFVKGLSEKTIAALVSERQRGGPFRSLLDLISRVVMSPREIESLVRVGACDELAGHTHRAPTPISIAPLEGKLGEPVEAVVEVTTGALNRKQLVWLVPAILSARTNAGKARRNSEGSISAKLGATGSDGIEYLPVQLLMGDILHGLEVPKILGTRIMRIQVPDMDDYAQAEKLHMERESLGFALSLNEMVLHRESASRLGAIPSNQLAHNAQREATVAGLLVAGRSHMAKGKDLMLFATVQDEYGLVEAVLFPDAYKANSAVLANNGCGPYLVRGTVQVSGKGRAIGLQPPPDLKFTSADSITMKVHPVLIVSELRPLVG